MPGFASRQENVPTNKNHPFAGAASLHLGRSTAQQVNFDWFNPHSANILLPIGLPGDFWKKNKTKKSQIISCQNIISYVMSSQERYRQFVYYVK